MNKKAQVMTGTSDRKSGGKVGKIVCGSSFRILKHKGVLEFSTYFNTCHAPCTRFAIQFTSQHP